LPTIYSRPKKLSWVHWTLIIFQSAAVVTIGGLVAVGFIEEAGFETRDQLKFVGVFIMFLALFYRSAFSILRRRPILEYDASSISSMKNTTMQILSPVQLTQLSSVVRRSPGTICLQFKERVEIELIVQGRHSQHGPMRAQEFEITGNEDDIDAFCGLLSRSRIAVADDPIPDSDPRKQYAILIISMAGVIAMFVGTLLLLKLLPK
jgi:hypothetical protein